MRAEPLCGKAFDMPSFLLMINDSWVHVFELNFNLALHRTANLRCNLLDSLADFHSGGFVVRADGTFHLCRIREHIMCRTCVKHTDSEGEVLLAVNVARFDRVKGLINSISTGDAVDKLVGC